MIWYTIPYGVSIAALLAMLLTGVLQSVAALEASELLQPHFVRRVRLHYGLLACVSLVLFLELVMAVSSIEGGLYLGISRVPRLVAILPVLHGIWCRRHPLGLPESLLPAKAGLWLPLLCLPLELFLPPPISALLICFAVAWLGLDAVHTLLTFQAYRRSELTRSIIPHMVRSIDYGLCVANARGWVIESNPAFTALCSRLDLPAGDPISAFDRALTAQQFQRDLEVRDLGGSLAIRKGDASYALRRQTFRVGRRQYTQLSLSDTTRLTRVSRTLEQDNRLLAERNRELEQVIARLGEEEAAHERERLCRMAHDAWSQQLAIAGLTVDMLIRQSVVPVDAAKLAECGALLAMPGENELALFPGDLDKAISRLAQSYRQLGVTTLVTGQARFTPAQEEALKPVLREAFANAVRHAYARTIEVRFFSEPDQAGLEIRNDTLDSTPEIAEGRGLHDIRMRVSQAGGSIQVSKKNHFSLMVTFDRTGEEDNNENRPD